jgi:ribonuclease VapC
MMVIDSSAIIAVILDEPGAPALRARIAVAEQVHLSAATFVESSIVMARRHGEPGVDRLDRLVTDTGMSIEPVTAERAVAARSAYLRYGKGLHPAALNFGDCFSYALARERDEPLLFVGDDFARTDVRAAVG